MQEKKIEVALSAIKSMYGTEDINLFISHHLEELHPEYWKKYTGYESPSSEDIFNILELKNIWDDHSIFDFSLPEHVTNYILSVTFNTSGEVEYISMES